MKSNTTTADRSITKKKAIYNYTLYAMMAALICIFAPMSVPIGPVPISLTNLVLYFAIFIIGTKGTTISYLVYLLIGAIGIPVFSNFTGGVAKLAGPTGGYLVGFIPMIFIMGIAYKMSKNMSIVKSYAITLAGMIIGTAVAYALGTAWFIFQMKCDLGYALSMCVFPFIPFDLGKMVIANILGRSVRKPLVSQGLID